MKLTKITYAILSGVIMLLTTFTSCNDVNDWEVDNNYNRLLRTSSITVTPSVFSAEFSWTAIPKAEYYIIELSKEVFTDEETISGTILGEDKSITSANYILTGLDSSTKYYYRIKAKSSSANDSKWAYGNTDITLSTFSTLEEQIFTDLSEWDIQKTNVTVKWEAGATVTKLVLSKPDGSTENFSLTDDTEIENGSHTITGLEAGTTYTITIYNEDIIRGSRTFTTDGEPGEEVEEIPDDYSKVTLSSSITLQNVLANPQDYVSNIQKLAIIIPSGQTIDATDEILLSPSLQNIIFWGEDGGEQPTMILTNMHFALREDGNNIGTFKFHNLKIKGSEANGYDSEYILFQGDKSTDGIANIATIYFYGCEISNYRNLIKYKQPISTGSTVGTVRFNNCIISNIKESVLTVYDKNAADFTYVGNIIVENSTIYNVIKSLFIINHSSKAATAKFKNTTIYKTEAAIGAYIIDSTQKNASVEWDNVIFAQAGSSGSVKYLRGTDELKATTNSYYCSMISTSFKKPVTSITVAPTELWNNPSEGDFHFKNIGLLTNGVAGDPRWYSAN